MRDLYNQFSCLRHMVARKLLTLNIKTPYKFVIIGFLEARIHYNERVVSVPTLCSGVLPSLSTAITSALCCSNSCSTSVCPQ